MQFTVVTYNMYHNKKGKENWSAILDAVDPDIVLAQESLHPEAYQRPLLSETWASRTEWSRVCQAWGAAVYCKHQEPKRLELPAYQGWVVGVEIDPVSAISTLPLRVFSVHNPTSNRSYQTELAGILDMLQEFNHGNLIVGGDFNLTAGVRQVGETLQTSKADSRLLARLQDELGLASCWQRANVDQPLEQTLRWSRDRDIPFHCDAIFAPQHWLERLTSCLVLRGPTWNAISDHNPVVAEFDVGPENKAR